MTDALQAFSTLPNNSRRVAFAYLQGLAAGSEPAPIAAAAPEKSPAERLAEYEAAGAVGEISTAGFSAEDFERLTQIEKNA